MSINAHSFSCYYPKISIYIILEDPIYCILGINEQKNIVNEALNIRII